MYIPRDLNYPDTKFSPRKIAKKVGKAVSPKGLGPEEHNGAVKIDVAQIINKIAKLFFRKIFVVRLLCYFLVVYSIWRLYQLHPIVFHAIILM